MKRADAAVIGAGPAGTAAAIQLSRQGNSLFLFEKERVGGTLPSANLIENYPGFPGGIRGADLAGLMAAQLLSSGIDVTAAEVFSLQRQKDGFLIHSSAGTAAVSFVVCASGTVPLSLDPHLVDSEVKDRVTSRIADIEHREHSTCIIIGGGDAAFDYALNLAGAAAQVHILYRSSRPKCLPVLAERASRHRNIRCTSDTAVTAIQKGGTFSCRVSCRSHNRTLVYEADHVLTALGRRPALDFITDEQQSLFRVNPKRSGVFYAGDVSSGRCRQTAIAAGAGVYAAMQIGDYINKGTRIT